LIPESDLDLFFVIDETKKDVFFNSLTQLMNLYIGRSDKKITYTFFRGPIKYKTKGLVHFLVYTISKNPNQTNKELFINEHKTVLISLVNTAKLIYGKNLNELVRDVNLKDSVQLENNVNRLKEKYEILKQEGYIDYPEWKKTRKGWQFLRTKKFASSFLKEYLLKYFEKGL
jgi:hypothetical protein